MTNSENNTSQVILLSVYLPAVSWMKLVATHSTTLTSANALLNCIIFNFSKSVSFSRAARSLKFQSSFQLALSLYHTVKRFITLWYTSMNSWDNIRFTLPHSITLSLYKIIRVFALGGFYTASYVIAIKSVKTTHCHLPFCCMPSSPTRPRTPRIKNLPSVS